MRSLRSAVVRLLIPVGAAAILPTLAATARAEDDHVVAEPATPSSQADQQQHLIDLGANFDANLFEQQGNGWVLRGDANGVAILNNINGRRGGGRLVVRGLGVVAGPGVPDGVPIDEERPPESPTFARARMAGVKRLERVTAACDLRDEQRHRLVLAMESDIRRFAAAIDTTRAKYAGVRVNLNEPEGQKTWQQFQHDVQQCRMSLRTLFAEGSLFALTLTSALDAQQLAAIDGELAARRSFRWRAMVVSVLAKMDDSLGLTDRQHRLLEEALLAREPTLRSEELLPEQNNAHLHQNLVYLVLSEADAKPFEKAMSDRQWRSLAQFMNQGKAMRSWIEQQGILEPDADATKPRAMSEPTSGFR